jgi:hypothetical protein
MLMANTTGRLPAFGHWDSDSLCSAQIGVAEAAEGALDGESRLSGLLTSGLGPLAVLVAS